MPLHIAIADDHGAVRIGVKYMIHEWMPGTRISYAESMAELASVLNSQSIDVVVLDINLPGGNNFRMIKQIKEKHPRIRILIFSAYEEMLYALRYIEAGADGYLQKEGAEEDFREAIKTVCRGGKYLSPAMRDHLLQRHLVKGQASTNPMETLTDREVEVCHLLVAGRGVSEIANELDLHTSTVGTYKNHIFRKMEVANLSELIEKVRLYTLAET